LVEHRRGLADDPVRSKRIRAVALQARRRERQDADERRMYKRRDAAGGQGPADIELRLAA
jgi:hypothetical protein